MSAFSESGVEPIDTGPTLDTRVDRVEPKEAAPPAFQLASPWDGIVFPEGAIWVHFSGEESGPGVIGDTSRLEKVYSVVVPSSGLASYSGSETTSSRSNVVAVSADAMEYTPEEEVDVVTFDHALTAIPNWFSAIDNAWNFLKPGGIIGVVDYYVSRQDPESGYAHHAWATRTFWPLWFARRNRFLSPDHVPYLHDLFERCSLGEDRAHIPYLPGEGVPRYTFVGRKRDED